MNLGNLKQVVADAPEAQESVLPAEFVAPYLVYGLATDGSLDHETTIDPVSRMFYAKRANSARPLDEEAVSAVSERTLNRLLSTTGVDNNIARKSNWAIRLFFNFANKDGDLISREVPVSIVRASYIFDQDEDMNPQFVSLESYLVKHGFLKKGALAKKSDTAKVEVPLVCDLNSMRLSKSGQNYVCKLQATGYIDAGNGDGTSIRIDVRTPETNIKVADFNAAVENILGGAENKVRASALSFVKTAVLFSLSMNENLRLHKGEVEGYVARDVFRMFGVSLAEVYYGKGEYSARETNYGFHAMVAGIFDLATFGGAWETVPETRVVKGEGWVMPVLNNYNH